MTTKLSLYNDALRILGERKLASLTENREPRRVLDDVYDGAVKFCLEEGQWKFAQRVSKLTYSTTVTPTFGYRRAFEKPSDFVRLTKLCSDEYFNTPILAYNEETGFWFCDLDEIYIGYVSNSTSYGLNLTVWPETFIAYLTTYLASQICERITQSATKLDGIEKALKKAKTDALSKDALEGPTQFLPTGSWSSARHGRGGAPRNNRSSLIG